MCSTTWAPATIIVLPFRLDHIYSRISTLPISDCTMALWLHRLVLSMWYLMQVVWRRRNPYMWGIVYFVSQSVVYLFIPEKFPTENFTPIPSIHLTTIFCHSVKQGNFSNHTKLK